jgi:transposase
MTTFSTSQDATGCIKEDAMSRVLIDDDLWSIVEPILPPWRPSSKGGQPRKLDRLCLTGILFVLKTGIPWEDFPQEMGCCGMTLWNRLAEWQQAGVWQKLHRVLLGRLHEANLIDWSRAVVDSASVRAVGGAKKPARIPRIAANPARSTTFSRMATGRRWSRFSPQPTATTSRN